MTSSLPPARRRVGALSRRSDPPRPDRRQARGDPPRRRRRIARRAADRLSGCPGEALPGVQNPQCPRRGAPQGRSARRHERHYVAASAVSTTRRFADRWVPIMHASLACGTTSTNSSLGVSNPQRSAKPSASSAVLAKSYGAPIGIFSDGSHTLRRLSITKTKTRASTSSSADTNLF
jgi:hypothetical protein